MPVTRETVEQREALRDLVTFGWEGTPPLGIRERSTLSVSKLSVMIRGASFASSVGPLIGIVGVLQATG